MLGSLYYGDNLGVLRAHVRNESVDLIYLDPPFNSNATYNVLFKAPSGQQSRAQIEAFEDTWHWGTEAESAFLDVLRNPRYGEAGAMLQAMRSFLRENDMMAYLAMMAARLIELHRVLRPTGSLYLHCDPTASHYLKILLDAVFGPENFMSEITWRRTAAHNATHRWPRLHDTILQFCRNHETALFDPVRIAPDAGWISREYRYQDEIGRYSLDNLTGAGITQGPSGQPWRDVDLAKIGAGRHWRYHPDTLDRLDAEGRIYWPRRGKYPKLKQYLAESKGTVVGDVWVEVPAIGRTAAERLGYPTQKPLALLERIIAASSNEGDTILDPFCGCGTAVHAAEKLNRGWIGIDITHLAISLIERRLRDAFPGIRFDVHGTPKDIEGARDLARRDKYQFQWWAVSLVDAVPFGGRKRGADTGIDGWRYMAADRNRLARAIVSVKGGENVSVQMLRDLRGVVERERAEAGLFITLTEPTRPMQEEAAKAGLFESPFGNKRHPRLQILTIAELLAGHKPDLPPLATEAGFRRAGREDRARRDQGDLLGRDRTPPPRTATP
ncbi:MAG: DNA methyltransferase [Acetobacteraceae bacterium]